MDKNFNYRIGLDIGIASVGWAVIEHNENDEPRRIVDLGVRTFDPAENPKDGASLAVDRRNARGLRRRLRRRAYRINIARDYLVKNLLDCKNIDNNHNLNVYELRYNALNKLLTNEELYYMIVHFIKHRGFKSNRSSDSEDNKTGELLQAINLNKQIMIEKKYRTIGEMIYLDNKFFDINPETLVKEYFVRNHSDYVNCFSRDDLLYELKLILNKQREFGNIKITDKFIEDVCNIFSKQRNFDDGPNAPSPYKSNFKVGTCTFETNEKRAPKGTFSFEYFNILQKINHLTYYDENSKKVIIDEKSKKLILDKMMEKQSLKYSDIRNLLNLSEDCLFTNLNYSSNKKENLKDLTKAQYLKYFEKTNFCGFDMVSKYAKKLNLNICKENKDLFDIIGYILSMRKSDEKRINLFKNNKKDSLFEDENVDKNLISALDNANLSDDDIKGLLSMTTDKFCNLSFKALNKINQYLELGLSYDKACQNAGYDFNKLSAVKKLKISFSDLGENGTNELQEITSPVVLRSVSQTIKVINAIIDKYGSPCAIYVELAREMAMSKIERNQMDNANRDRAIDNQNIISKLKELGITNPKGQDIIKYRLYMDQDGKSAYSLKSFESVLGSVKEIFNNNNTQIDHIMPYSKCFDDSYNNKVLVLSNENAEKGNRVPREYITNENDWNKFENWVNSSKFSKRKKNKLLLQNSHIDNNELNSRALNDTKQASKFIYNMLRNHLIFKNSKLSKKPVIAVNGSITAYLRKIWGISKIRFESDKHHSVDACVIACANDSTIQKITKYEKYKYIARAKQKNVLEKKDNMYVDKITGEVISFDDYSNYFKSWEEDYDRLNGKMYIILQPYQNFTKELEIREKNDVNSDLNMKELMYMGYSNEDLNNVKPIFVSRMPKRKVLGPIHKETIYSSKIYSNENKKLIKRIKIQDLKLSTLKNYSEYCKNADPLLYNALVDRLSLNNDNGKTAFSETFYKPKKLTNGEIVPSDIPVKTIKIEETASDFVTLDEKQNKVALKSNMVRVDVFKIDGKNYVVPIYVSDVYKQTLPNIAVPYANNKVMSDENFAFSLYPNDLVYLEKYNGSFKGWYAESKSENSGLKYECQKGYFYYRGTDISTGCCNFETNDSSVLFRGVGIQSTNVFEKCVVDVLGNVSRVKKEKRMPLKFKRNK